MDGVERAAAARAAATKFSAAPSVGFDLLETDGRPDDLSGLLRHAGAAIESPERYFEPDTPVEFTQDGESITFKSPLASGAANDVARARLSEVRHRERAVVLLHHWNAEVEAYRPFARLLAASGIACLQLSLPYHHERRTPGVGFARELVCENLGLTIRSNRQAILEVRACLAWLERQGFRRLGIIGVSVGSSIGSIVAALDSRVSAAVLILMADDFAEVVWTGSATAHVKSSLERRFSFQEVQAAWALISPATYAERLSQRLNHALIISGRHDAVFIPESTRRYVDRLSTHGLNSAWIRFGCGHYTLRLFPFSVLTVMNTITFLRRQL
ncbi:alpha/beta hydrolase family protein [Bradyrhizobium yuanmingense]|uniref:alpha/beta hydrolase family protein n=1 Tax=Bradyrhizobium yuanmingense TaxID=108015 RepID=UPI0012FE7C12|nr:alpha/beta hydrolase family protein [Bradyrhizobium yuanmingense]